MVRAPACQYRTVVRFHLRHFEAWLISFTPLCLCLSEETLNAVGPNSCVSLGCLEYNYLRLRENGTGHSAAGTVFNVAVRLIIMD